MTKEEIITELKKVTTKFVDECAAIDDAIYFQQRGEKWSIAQDVHHIITSADATRLAYALPKFMIRWYTGKTNRPSRTYDELVNKYKAKLEKGGRASGRFIPKKISPKLPKEKQLKVFEKVMNLLISKIEKKWDDNLLDNYLAPHPLLGKITLRELGYFTIYHTLHHLAIIQTKK